MEGWAEGSSTLQVCTHTHGRAPMHAHAHVHAHTRTRTHAHWCVVPKPLTDLPPEFHGLSLPALSSVCLKKTGGGGIRGTVCSKRGSE